jgi:hypothetical protein
MTDPVLLTIIAALGRIISDIVRGTLGKESALRELEASAQLLRDDLRADAVARGELAADAAQLAKLGPR